ncbi:WYL domain-containing protein [Leifsonia sp. NPDC077715]|uniref:helix-turn-helix transcriptional regulator n=1 Tax=Leifsonia sp. NPDC077715 TaxID=3155539 RepID=UPI003416062F
MTTTSSRMLEMLSLLQARRDWPGAELADRLEVTTRTVRRDVERLRELGYRIEALKGPAGGYRLGAGSELPPLLFDEEQAVAVAVALQNAGASGAAIEEAAARALATVRQVMPSRLRHRIDGLRFDRPSLPQEPVAPEVLTTVSDAVRERRVLRFDYADADGPARRAEPHGLVARDGRWYLVAWELDRDNWRIFRLDRLRPRIPGGGPFRERPIPNGDAVRFVDAKFRGSDGDGWPRTGVAILRVPAAEAALWLPDAIVEPVGDVSCRVIAGSWSWMGLVASLARFDAAFEIVGPPEFREAAAALARRSAAAAATAGPAPTPAPPRRSTPG